MIEADSLFFEPLNHSHYESIQQAAIKNKFVNADVIFSTLWIYNFYEKVYITLHNKNIILLIIDEKITASFFYLLGDNNIDATLQAIYKYASKNKYESVIKFSSNQPFLNLSESTLRKVIILEDRDNFDYIISTSQLAVSTGHKYRILRKEYKRFQSQFSSEISFLDKYLSEADLSEIQDYYSSILISEKKYPEVLELEKHAINQLFANKAFFSNIRIAIFYLNSSMVGFFIYEKIKNNLIVIHIMRSDYASYKSINSYMFIEFARLMLNLGIEYINIEQDLGIPGLKKKKMLLRPAAFTEKYIIYPTT